MAVAARLKYARERIGMTLADVAPRTGVGLSSLSEFENGKREPKLSQLQSLARAYNRSVAFFLEEGPIPTETVLWRQRPESPVAEEIETKFLRLCQQYHNLEVWCGDQKPCALPTADFSASEFGYPQAKDLANRVAVQLQLGSHPAPSLWRVLEEACGVKVLHLDFEPTGSAASMKSDSLGSAILLNRRSVRWRRNFDLAHELFHILTWDLFRTGGQTETSQQEEKWATCFARSLLMPTDALRSALLRIRPDRRLLPQDAFDLAREFDVSVDAIMWQLSFSSNLREEQIQPFLQHCKTLSAVYEKRDNDAPPERPERYFALALRALRSGEMSLGRFAEYLGISRKESETYLEDELSEDEEIQVTPT